MCIYPVQPVCTFLLHIPAYIIIYYVHSILYCTFYFIAHFTLFFLFLFLTYIYIYIYIYSCVVLHILHCPLSGPDPTYISLLIVSCIIEYVTNKKNLEPSLREVVLFNSNKRMLCVTAVKLHMVCHDTNLISNLYNEFGHFWEMLNKYTITKPIRFKLTKFIVDSVDYESTHLL